MIWLIGSGPMAESYIEVLKGMKVEFTVIGRGETSAKNLEEKHQVRVVRGGIKTYLATSPKICDHAIVAVGVEQLYDCTKDLIEYGVRNVLVEKPGSINSEQIKSLHAINLIKKANVLIAYNRRFYASVIKAQEIIKEDGGVSSFQFEFTEWSNVIEKLEKPKEVLANWLTANSSHVIDLAFFLGGRPVKLSSFASGKNQLAWHPANSSFSGAGVTDQDALFSYSSNWLSPGRWGLEIMTPKHRLYFRPMEQLQIQQLASVKVEPCSLENEIEKSFKPGLFLQTKAFLQNDHTRFCTLEEQVHNFDIYDKIRG